MDRVSAARASFSALTPSVWEQAKVSSAAAPSKALKIPALFSVSIPTNAAPSSLGDDREKQRMEKHFFEKQAREMKDLEAREAGIGGVPFFIFNREVGVSGAHEPETLLQAMNQAREKAGKV